MSQWSPVKLFQSVHRRVALAFSMLAIVALAASALTLTSSQSDARQGSSSPAGLGFNCDVNTRSCTCTGTYDGADCRAMASNCINECEGQGDCKLISCGASGCECKMKAAAVRKWKRLQTQQNRPDTNEKPKKSTGSP